MYNYFFLNEHSFLIKGIKRGAIYNLFNGEVFSVGSMAAEVLTNCESGKSLNVTFERIGNLGIDKKEVLDYLSELEKMDLGSFFNKPMIINKIRYPMVITQ